MKFAEYVHLHVCAIHAKWQARVCRRFLSSEFSSSSLNAHLAIQNQWQHCACAVQFHLAEVMELMVHCSVCLSVMDCVGLAGASFVERAISFSMLVGMR